MIYEEKHFPLSFSTKMGRKLSTESAEDSTLGMVSLGLGECHPDGQPVAISVHHLGTAYANGAQGNLHDKHDLRRENLVALCDRCHFQADLPLHIEHWRKERLRRRGRMTLVVYSAYL